MLLSHKPDRKEFSKCAGACRRRHSLDIAPRGRRARKVFHCEKWISIPVLRRHRAFYSNRELIFIFVWLSRVRNRKHGEGMERSSHVDGAMQREKFAKRTISMAY